MGTHQFSCHTYRMYAKTLLFAVLFSISLQEDLFNPTPLVGTNPPWDSGSHSRKPGSLWGSMSRPFPTNVWWENMVNDPGDLLSVVNPYVVKTLDDGLHVCLPERVTEPNYVYLAYVDNLVMSAQEDLGDRTVTKYDDLSVTMTWQNGIQAPIVRGMPYATVFYNNLTPKLTFGHAVVAVVNVATEQRFEVSLDNGQKWLVYASEEISLTLSESTLVASDPLTGWIRAAAVWESSGEGDEQTLNTFWKVIPTGGKVSAEVSGDTAIMKFNWELAEDDVGFVMMMALPHHLDTLVNLDTDETNHKLMTLKGEMVGILGRIWEFSEPLTTISWNAPRPMAEDKIADIKAALENDIANESNPPDDPYFGGKKMALFARLSLIADEIGETELAQQARDRTKEYLEGWLGGTNPNKLLYEDVWGGVVSSCGLQDEQCDFGNGMYNDHHFHYGYHIYTAAVLAKADPAWGQQWEERVLHMMSDLAEPSRNSQWYPFTRTKDWYDGHAWASGIFPFADGKNQESTSESVNGWYAIYLWGLVTDNARVKDLGRLMTALEIRAAKRYWQMTSDHSAFPAPFSDHKTVGIIWSVKADYNTWFGDLVEFIHCIQMIPFVPISEELLGKEWIQEEYEVLKEAYDRQDPPLSEQWKGYVVMAHAILDPQTAYDEALQLTAYDDGNTKSNTLWWIATRP